MNNEFPFTLTTLADNPEYFDEVIALIEREFHYGSNQSFSSDFALLMNPLNFDNCFLYIDQNTNHVVSHLAVCPRVMVKNNLEINVAFIGGIATVKEYRGRDLFKKLMNHALKTFSKECGLFILWSEITGLYEKFSFHLNGGLVETGQGVFSAENPPMGFKRTSFKNLSMKDFEKIIEIYTEFNQKYFFTVTRTEKEWSIIKEMSSIDLYLKRNEEGVIEQYFCINKGRDLTNIIHEVGCLPDQYLNLMKTLKRFKTWLPESESTLSENKDIFFTAFIRLGNLEILKSFFNQLSEGHLELISMTGDRIIFKFNEVDYEATHRDFMQYVFGPKPLKEFERFYLSPYIPGVDSI